MKKSIILLSIALSMFMCSSCSKETRSVSLPDFIPENEPEISAESGLEEKASDSLTEEVTIYVSVMGEVNNPGVYIFKNEARVYELINEAGGFTDNADLSKINLVSVLSDGMQLMVPPLQTETVAEFCPETSSSDNSLILSESDAKVSSDTSGKININTATLNELMTLPGIGETRGKAIISYRENGSSFSTPEDIMKVSGIKENTYNSLKDYICVY